MSANKEPAVKQVDQEEYDSIKNQACELSHDSLLDEYAHLVIRENELEGQVNYLNKIIRTERKKAVFTHDIIGKEQSWDIQQKWTEHLKGDQ